MICLIGIANINATNEACKYTIDTSPRNKPRQFCNRSRHYLKLYLYNGFETRRPRLDETHGSAYYAWAGWSCASTMHAFDMVMQGTQDN